MTTPKLKARAKMITSKHQKFAGYESTNRPAVKIIKCIGFQKFRYCGENRPGKKYQDKDFLQLALSHMSGKNVRVQIVCFDAEHQQRIHPNGLVGRDCQHGVYSRVYPISKNTQIIRIPYLRTERILTKKTLKDEKSKIKTVFEERAQILPPPYHDICLKQSTETFKYDTTRVCFGVIITTEDIYSDPLFCISNVVQNASEKTTLKIYKLSTQYVSAQEGGEVDIFTTEDGPPITAGKCTVKVVQTGGEWSSEETKPTQDQILYKRVVTYRVPAFAPNPAIDTSLRAAIQLSCTQSGQTCTYEFNYEPGADSARRLATIHSNKPLRKRPYVSDVADDFAVNGADSIKLRVKEKVRSRQNQDFGPTTYDSQRSEFVQNNLPITVSSALEDATPTTTVSSRDGVPLHQQDDIVLAKDILTGEVVYIRTQQSQNQSSDVVMYVHDTQQTLNSDGGLPSVTLLSDTPRAVAVPASEWNAMVSPSKAATANSTVKVETQNKLSSVHATSRKTKFISPWVVGELENTPLINGDISFSQSKSDTSSILYSSLKQEPVEMGPPILKPSFGNFTVSGSNLLSGTLISANNFASSNNLPSLNSLFNNGVLEGVRFDESGTLLSSSVFEMVQPYIEKMEK